MTRYFFYVLIFILLAAACRKTVNNYPSAPPVPNAQISITAINPAAAETGPIRIIGAGFHPTAANNEVLLDSIYCRVISGNSQELEIELPPSLNPGIYNVTVKRQGQTAVRQRGFQFIPFLVTQTAENYTFMNPIGICANAQGKIFVSDGNKILQIEESGLVSIFAGANRAGLLDGKGGAAQFHFPGGLASDSKQQIYVADQWNHVIRKIDSNGNTVTIAGTGQPGDVNGEALLAKFDSPYDLALSPDEQFLYITDFNNNLVRELNLQTNQVTTIAAIAAPMGIAVDQMRRIFISECQNGDVWLLSNTGPHTRIATAPRTHCQPAQIKRDQEGNLYVVYTAINQIRKITPAGVSSLFAGNELTGDVTGTVFQARFRQPEGILIMGNVDGQESFYLTDSGNRKIKRIVKP